MKKYLQNFFVLAFLVLSTTHFNVLATNNCDEFQCSNQNQDSAQYLACLSNKKTCLENKLATVQEQKTTLTNTIKVIAEKINLQEISIAKTLVEIEQLEKEITLLDERIDTLDLSLDQLTEMLLERVRTKYKKQLTAPLIDLSPTSLSSMENNQEISHKYVSQASQQTAIIMHKATVQKQLFDSQKKRKEVVQHALEEKKKLLEQQKKELATQKTSQQQLLVVTKNDEKTYQKLLANALAEITGLRNYSASKGGGSLSPQNSPDGWFFSQRDERWSSFKIGGSGENVMNVGCLISSVAMIKKKFGEDVNPISIAANTSYFFGNTAYMLRPYPAPSGHRYETTSFSSEKLSQELSKNPVIVKLATGPYGTHFIVIKEKQDNQYIMHDPWEGYDKNFSDYYSTGQIMNFSYLVKN